MKNTKIWLTIILLNIVNIGVSQDGKVLNVPYVHQIGNTCWAAASTETLQYYGKDIQLCEFIANVRNECHNCCNNFNTDNVNCTSAGYNSEIIKGLKHWGLSLYDNPNSAYRILSFVECKKNIDQGKPFMIRWYQKWNGGGHIIVCNGYLNDDAKYLYYVNSADGYHVTSYDWIVENDKFKWDWTISFSNTPQCSNYDLIFTNSITTSKQYKSSNNINVSTIISSSNVKFEFGNEFTAEQGFEVKLGSAVEINPNKSLKCE